MSRRWLLFSVLAVIIACLLSLLVYNLPPVHSRLAWRLDSAQAQIYYYFNPPQEAVFIPQEQQIEAIVQATLQALPTFTVSAPSDTPLPSLSQAGASPTPQPSPTPTLTPTPLPEKATLTGLKHEYQQMNNCGPATLAMALSYWGWQGDQRDTRLFLRPNFATVDDKNVMPAEMVEYVEQETGLKALVRVGGDVELLKRFIAAGFPVLIEKGFQPPKEDWMGHFEVINAYDDGRQRFITQDSYIMADFPLPYDQLTDRWWRDFNYVYLVIYPPDREAEAMSILGPQADPAYNYQHAAQVAREETAQLSGRDLFFAWFNLGTNLLAQGDYPGSAQAYDQAFAIYAALPDVERPWRTLWYQVGPYEAYYQTGRYQDVINLANTTLSFMRQPVLEESFFWRGLAKEKMGDSEGAIADLRKSIELNPNFTPAYPHLERLGIQTP
jgi:hypothetical protein